MRVSLYFNSILFCTCYLYYVCLSALRFFFSRLNLVSSRHSSNICVFFLLIDNDVDSNMCITFHLRIANRMVTDSRCREGIVNILGGCSHALQVER